MQMPAFCRQIVSSVYKRPVNGLRGFGSESRLVCKRIVYKRGQAEIT